MYFCKNIRDMVYYDNGRQDRGIGKHGRFHVDQKVILFKILPHTKKCFIFTTVSAAKE